MRHGARLIVLIVLLLALIVGVTAMPALAPASVPVDLNTRAAAQTLSYDSPPAATTPGPNARTAAQSTRPGARIVARGSTSSITLGRATKGVPNFVGPVRQSSSQIGHGHAFGKHVIEKGEFPEVSTPDDLARVVERVRTHGTHQRPLTNGRRAFYDARDNTLVIRNPNSKNGGTVFRPDDGLDYFNDLK